MDLYAINCPPTVLKLNWPTLFMVELRCSVVEQKLRGLEYFEKQMILHIYNILAINNYYMYISIQLLSIL
jgi:hypothetical protein